MDETNNNVEENKEEVVALNREAAVLMELNAICLTLDRLSNVLDDLLTLTELPASSPIRKNNGTSISSSIENPVPSNIYSKGNNAPGSSSSISIAKKQMLLLEELARWKDVFSGGGSTDDENGDQQRMNITRAK
jgi:hypothetical protein